jgi:hypothetical protein
MEKLRKSLTCIGLGDAEISRLRLLLKFLSSSLDMEWFIQEPGTPGQVCLVDLDLPSGEQFWRNGAEAYEARVAVTELTRDGIEWEIHRPWHRSDDMGLVSVLNRLTANQKSTGTLQSLPLPASPKLALQENLTLSKVIQECERDRTGIRLQFRGLSDIWLNGSRSTYCSPQQPTEIHEAFRLHSTRLEYAVRSREFPMGEERPLAQLKWICAISGMQPAVPWNGRYVRLKRWPDFASLPHDLVHLRLAAAMLRQPVMLTTLVRLLNTTMEEAVAFCIGLQCLDLLEEHSASAHAQMPTKSAASPQMNQDGSGAKSQLLRKVLTAIYARQA